MALIVILRHLMSHRHQSLDHKIHSWKKVRDMGGLAAMILFLTMFLGVGLRDIARVLWFYTWKRTPCSIERFEIRDDPKTQKAFRPDLLFHYQWEGRRYDSTRLWRNTNDTDNAEEITAAKDAVSAGRLVDCRVNPANPAEAALLPDALPDRGLFFVVFTVGIGATLIGAIRVQWRGEDPQNHPKIVLPFFLVFAFIGGWMLAKGFVPHVTRYLSAMSWQETIATVKWSRVGEHRQVRSGPTYYPDLYYTYGDGELPRRFHSNRVSIFPLGLGGYDGSRKFTHEHPAGSTMKCWFNPDKPWQATLDRDLHWSLLGALFAVPFLGIGLGGLWWVKRRVA